jgi:type II secretory pathway component GspD/PulD (secretin)
MMRLFALALALVVTSAAHAETRVLTLKNRPPEQVAALLQPLLPPGAGVIAANGQLILHGDKGTVDELAKLADTLDVKPRQLRITVRDSGEALRSAVGVEVSGSLSRPRLDAYGKQSRERPSSERTVRAMEGQWARIDAGHSIPVRSHTTVVRPHGAIVQESTSYEDVGSGFEVLPRLAGSSVVLEIRAFNGSVPNVPGGAIARGSTQSSVEVPLGEWADLSSVNGSDKNDRRGTFYSEHARSAETRNLQVKVELVP